MRQSQWERIRLELSSGQWVPVERFMEMHIPDYRKRLSEMRAWGESLESRTVRHERLDGTSWRSKQWRDLDAVDRLRAVVRDQVAAYRTTVPDNRTRISIVTSAGTVTVMGGRLRLLTVESMTDEIMRGLGID